MKRSFIIVILLFFTSISFAQKDNPKVTCNYKNIPFSKLIDTFEKKYNLHFFFNEDEFSRINFTFSCENKPLNECIEMIFHQMNYKSYFINNKIFIFRGDRINEILASSTIKTNTNKTSLRKEKYQNRDVLLREQYKIHHIGTPNKNHKNHATLSGKVKLFNTNSSIPGCNIYTKDKKYGTSTDSKGNFSLRLPIGDHTIIFSSVGMESTKRQIRLYSNGKLPVDMEAKVNVLEDIKVLGAEKNNLSQVKIGFDQIDMESIKNLPKLLGEPDIIKSMMILPGVTSVGEGTSGFNVRGGKSDQNLILLNSAPIYYPTHFFGNFSAINSDLIKKANLYKGSFPVKYGGRISSVYQLETRRGNRQKIKGAGGISPLAANFTIEGPIKKNKSSFILSTRGTYSDWILKKIDVDELHNSKVNFYDAYTKFSFDLLKKHKLNISFYGSKDAFKLRSDTTYNYLNFIGEVNLTTALKENWSMYNSFSSSLFGYSIKTSSDSLRAFKTTHSLQNFSFKNHFIHEISLDTKIHFGSELQAYIVNPGKRKTPSSSELSNLTIKKERAIEYGFFTGINFSPFERLKIETGVRLSGYLYLSNGLKNIYKEGLPLTEDNLIETIEQKKNSVQKHYIYPEFRFSSNYSLSPCIALKFSYNTTSQFLHLLSNTTAISPTDTWKLSDEYLKPQKGHLFSVGSVWQSTDKVYEISLEGFYKRMSNMKEFKAGADLLLNKHIETEILNAQGKSYGLEFTLQKKQGKLSGRLGYTYARTLIKTKSKFPEELINNGDYFPANYDKPHQLNIVLNWEPIKKITISTLTDYSTGRPITYPVSKYTLGNQTLLHYSDYNQYRIPDYFRINLSLTIDRNLRKNKRFDSSWSFSIYNVTGRKNAYSVYYKNKGKNYEAYKLSIFGTVIPTITYKFKF